MMSRWTWPIPSAIFQSQVLDIDNPGSFGVVRKSDIHTGVDLYCSDGDLVVACEDGVIVDIDDFTGTKADSPWWNDTMSIMIEGASGVILYGEVMPQIGIKVGDEIVAGQSLGYVKQVLKKYKGNPMSMLHLELYTPGSREAVWWFHNDPKPPNLLDPTEFLREFDL